jgi:hypothetical protein
MSSIYFLGSKEKALPCHDARQCIAVANALLAPSPSGAMREAWSKLCWHILYLPGRSPSSRNCSWLRYQTNFIHLNYHCTSGLTVESISFVLSYAPVQNEYNQSYQIAFIPNPGSLMSKCATRAKYSSCQRYISTNPCSSSVRASHSSVHGQGLTAFE